MPLVISRKTPRILLEVAKQLRRVGFRRLVGLSTPLHTWRGIYFGEREGISLFTVHGIEVGRFYGNEVYGADGGYLGELKDGKLITHQAKQSKCRTSFRPQHKARLAENKDQDGSVMLLGYEDFPRPKTFC
jgi:sporulation protein YlmC with PRC-barrel domain